MSGQLRPFEINPKQPSVMILNTGPVSRDAWQYSFRVEQAKGLDHMIMTGTKLTDLKSTLHKDNKSDIMGGHIGNLTGDYGHTMTQSFDFTNNQVD